VLVKNYSLNVMSYDLTMILHVSAMEPQFIACPPYYLCCIVCVSPCSLDVLTKNTNHIEINTQL